MLLHHPVRQAQDVQADTFAEAQTVVRVLLVSEIEVARFQHKCYTAVAAPPGLSALTLDRVSVR